MAAGWYYRVAEETMGPMPLAQLMDSAREGKFAPNDMVRKKTGEWVVGNTIKGLFPPAITANADAVPQTSPASDPLPATSP